MTNAVTRRMEKMSEIITRRIMVRTTMENFINIIKILDKNFIDFSIEQIAEEKNNG